MNEREEAIKRCVALWEPTNPEAWNRAIREAWTGTPGSHRPVPFPMPRSALWITGEPLTLWEDLRFAQECEMLVEYEQCCWKADDCMRQEHKQILVREKLHLSDNALELAKQKAHAALKYLENLYGNRIVRVEQAVLTELFAADNEVAYVINVWIN